MENISCLCCIKNILLDKINTDTFVLKEYAMKCYAKERLRI